MTAVAPQRTAGPPHRHPRIATAVAIALLIAGLTIGLLLAFSGGTAGPAGKQAPPTSPGHSAGPPSSTVDPCWAKLRGPC